MRLFLGKSAIFFKQRFLHPDTARHQSLREGQIRMRRRTGGALRLTEHGDTFPAERQNAVFVAQQHKALLRDRLRKGTPCLSFFLMKIHVVVLLMKLLSA